MSRAGLLVDGADLGFPRVSGDEPGTSFGLDAAATFSPRERG